MKRRVERLEEGSSEEPGSLEVTVRRTIVRPAPEGRATIAVLTTRYRDGVEVSRVTREIQEP